MSAAQRKLEKFHRERGSEVYRAVKEALSAFLQHLSENSLQPENLKLLWDVFKTMDWGGVLNNSAKRILQRSQQQERLFSQCILPFFQCSEIAFIRLILDSENLNAVDPSWGVENGKKNWCCIQIHYRPHTRQRVRNTPHTATLNSTLDDLMKNKGGIEINPFFPIKEKIEKHNTCEKIYQVLNKGRIARKIQHVQVVDKHGKKPSIISLPSNAAVIEPNCKIDITIRVSPSSVGTFDYILVARFEGFDIGRKICLEVNDHISRDNTATSRYIQELPLRLPPPNEVYDKKSQSGALPFVRKIDQQAYQLPKGFMQMFGENHYENKAAEERFWQEWNPFVNEHLCRENYQDVMIFLSHLEEKQCEYDIKMYDQKNIQLTVTRAGFFRIEVPGVSEKRPSILRGDKVLIRFYISEDKLDTKEYRGIIMEVNLNEILIDMCQEFVDIYRRENVYLRFKCKNTIWVMQRHMLLHLPNPDPLSVWDLIFPREEGLRNYNLQSAESSITYGPSLASGGLNERQSQALHYILDGSLAQEDCLSPPYIIFGPPGTGKTTTVVEAIYQLFRKSNTRILACCPSNSACDLIIERLSAFITTHDMIRVNSFNRDYNAISGLVMEYSIYDKTKGGFFLNNAKIRQRKVVVCTLATSAKLYHDGIYSNEFSHVFIDEAGHAIEQEAILPIVNLFDSSDGTNRVILAGDPKQLGPVIQSTLAKRMGEDISFLERLINTIQIYSRSDDYEEFGCYNPQVMTKLVRNYRSHPDIIHCPNALFYDNDLIPCADPAITERLLHFSELPNPNSPIVVCGVQGMEARERGSPSWFNAQEISVVVEWVNKLMTTRDVSERDIGIISPYAKQVSKLRKELERQGRLSVDVGSVEQFQGQEKDIIIVSTVRSSHEFEDFDLKFHLGFLKNAKRFNVAVTRAKCLFILIGNPEVLLIDRCWGNLTQWAINNRAYTGCSLPVDLSSSPGSTDLDEQQRFQLLMDNAMSFLQQWRLGVETQSEDASTSDSEGKSD